MKNIDIFFEMWECVLGVTFFLCHELYIVYMELLAMSLSCMSQKSEKCGAQKLEQKSWYKNS